MTTLSPSTYLRRQERRQRNDEVILCGAVQLAADEGWAGLTPGHIAEVTGLSRPTVLQRHGCRADVGAAVWEARAWEPLREALLPLIAADDAAQVQAALNVFLEPTLHMRAAVELLVVSAYVPQVMQVVAATFGRWLEQLVGDVPEQTAARRCFAVGAALGLILESHALGRLWPQLRHEMRYLAAGLASVQAPVRLPDQRAEFPCSNEFNTGDRTWDAVLAATVESVSEVGYEAATIELIAARCGFTRTVIFRRYSSKYELFRDASERTLGPLILAMDAQRREVERQCGTGISDAWFGREVMRPDLRDLRTIILEQVRLATHLRGISEVLGDALAQPERPMAHVFAGDTDQQGLGKRAVELAIASGMLILAQVRPESWTLPYDVALVPWRQAQAAD